MHSDLNGLNATELYTLKNGQNGNSYVIHILPQCFEKMHEVTNDTACSEHGISAFHWLNPGAIRREERRGGGEIPLACLPLHLLTPFPPYLSGQVLGDWVPLEPLHLHPHLTHAEMDVSLRLPEGGRLVVASWC